MEIRRATLEDLIRFLQLARKEGWRVPCGELKLYRRELAGCAFVLRREDTHLGFVTASDYGRTGWIGNLLVPREYRGRGYGRQLFSHAIDVLRFRGVSSFWLTASIAGRPLYQRLGFRTVGRIARWIHAGAGTSDGMDPAGEGASVLHGLDAEVWGEPRRKLLDPLCRHGRVLRSGATAALLQEGERTQVLGPWMSPSGCPRENRQILASAVDLCHPGRELAVDILTSSPCAALPAAAGFTPCGENELMVLGKPGEVRLESLVALASLGSLG